MALLLSCQAPRLYACFAVVVGREASADGSVLVGHNEENAGRRILNFRRIPRRRFEQGAAVGLRRGGELPQVNETWAFLWSEIPGLEFSDGYLNEWGVAIVSNACQTREDGYEALVKRGEIRDGGIGYMLRRLVAERARSAREGVELAGRLVERFGYVDSGRTYVIADPRQAWLLSVVRGRRWVARRVPDDAVAVLPNVHIIAEMDLKDTGSFLGSPDVIDYAVKRGWLKREGGEAFRFCEVYQSVRGRAPDPRRWWGQQLVTGRRRPWPPEQPLPFAVKPARKLTVAALAAILRSYTDRVPLCSANAQESAVFQLRAAMPKEVGCVYWRTTGMPCTNVLTPWYLGIIETPKCYYRSVDLRRHLTLDRHFRPPRGTFDPDLNLAWWKFKKLQDLVHEAYQSRIKIARPVWAAFESRVFRRQQAVEKKALKLWGTDKDSARAYLTRYCSELAAQACQEADRLAEVLQGRRPE